jgi:hypothetical protein
MEQNEIALAAGGIGLLGEQITKLIPGAGKVGELFGVMGKNALYFSGVSDGLTENLKSLAGVLSTDIATSLNSLADKLKVQINNFQELDRSIIQLGRGDSSRAFIDSMKKQSFEAARLGVSLETVIDINKKLLEGYSGAIIVSDRQAESFNNNRKAMMELVAFNEKFGVSQQDSITVLNNFNNVLGGGTKAAQTFSDQLLIFSQKTGQSATKVFGEFNQNIERFSVLSADKAVSAFQKIELSAARTGQSISAVLSSIEKFDDIDNGFQAGGQLNRVLSFMGGSFDTFAAIQASDEERATMLYQAISGVSDKYSQLQTDQAKRSFAKQLVESSGVDMKTVVGLLNKSTDLSKDLADISRMPIVSDSFTSSGREAAAMRLTTSDELKKLQTQLFDLNPIVITLSDNVKENTKSFTNFSVSFFKGLDSRLGPAIQNGGPQAFINATKAFIDEVVKLPSKFQDSMSNYKSSTKPETDGIIKGNTEAITNLRTLFKDGIKVDVSGKLETPTGVIPLSATKQGKGPSTATALNR